MANGRVPLAVPTISSIGSTFEQGLDRKKKEREKKKSSIKLAGRL